MKRLLPVLVGFALLLFSSTEGWSLPPCEGSYNKTTWTDCTGAVSDGGGGKYVGEFRNGKYNGQGTITFPSGGIYVGGFKDNIQHG